MSRRAIQSINWSALGELIPESERQAFGAFKAKSELFMRRMNAYPESAPKIDWDYYKKNISTAGLVDSFKKQYEGLSIPFPADKYTAQIEEEKKAEAVRIQEFKKEADQEIQNIQQEVNKVLSMLPLTEMTLEEFWQAYPDQVINADQPSCWPHDEESQPGHPSNETAEAH